MRVGVIGAGAVGGTMAALLHRAGHEVRVTARGEHLRALRRDGILLDGAWGSHRADVDAEELLAPGCELVLVTTKAADAAGALQANRGVIDCPVVIVQNGLSGPDTARRALPGRAVVGGLALFAASLRAPGEVTVTAAGSLVLGTDERAADERDADARRRSAALLGGVLPVRETGNLRGALWTKLVINQVNALPAITGTSVQQVVAHRGLRRVLTAGMREAVRVARAGGVRLDPLPGMTAPALRLLAAAPLGVAQVVPLRMAARMGPVPNPASTLQSIRRGVPTEVDALNGAVVAAASEAGLRVPVNRAMVELVHEVERTGRFLAAPEVLRRLRVHG